MNLEKLLGVSVDEGQAACPKVYTSNGICGFNFKATLSVLGQFLLVFFYLLCFKLNGVR